MRAWAMLGDMRGACLLVLGSLVVSCTPIRPLNVDPDGSVDASARDAGAPDAGEPDAGAPEIDAGCTTGEVVCDGAQRVECIGGERVAEDCPYGCGGDPAVCLRFVPSNVEDRVALDAGGASLTLERDVLFNTDTGEIREATGLGAGAVVRGAGTGEIAGIEFALIDMPDGQPDLGVFGFRALRIPVGITLGGVGDAALVILAEERVDVMGEITVDGTIRFGFLFGRDGAAAGAGGAAASGDGGGLGGGRGGTRPGPFTDDGGGGGGSFSSSGGMGGATEGGLPGGVYGSDDLVPLIGGSGGGGGNGARGNGGDGGGAVQVSAGEAIVVGPMGVVSACGDGGAGSGGTDMEPATGAGGGGGSGGAILLEAPEVTIMGRVGANGGAGAQGNVESNMISSAGPNGSVNTVPAPGPPSSGNGGAGGDGSGVDGAAGDGADANHGGGGGGGAGRIRINNLAGEGAYDLSPTLGSGSSVGPLPAAP